MSCEMAQLLLHYNKLIIYEENTNKVQFRIAVALFCTVYVTDLFSKVRRSITNCEDVGSYRRINASLFLAVLW
jgi:hypothetical protein